MSKSKILVVEDEAITAKDIQDRLKGLGYDVPAIASSGEGAIKKTEEIKPDLVLMDIVLKGDMKGIEAAVQIRDRFDIPVVYLTAHIDEASLEKIRATEPYGYITKPFEDKELRPAIEMALQRHKLEKSLRSAEQDWRNSFNSLDDVMLIIDRDYNIENINEIGLNLLGKSKEEVIGQKCYQVISGADSPGEDCPCMKSLETKKVESTDRYEARFGKYFAIKSSPMLDENGEVIKFVDLRRDISERKRAEDALRASEQWLSTTLRSLGDAVIATDAQGLVSLMNPVAEILTGWYEAEALGKPLEDVFNIINEQTGAQAENPVARVLREGVVVGLANHTVLIAKDETKRPIADSGAPISDAEGNLMGTVMVFRDISELRMMEEALQKQMYVLGERVKELNCFYNISELVETPGNSLEELLRGSLSIIPPAWRYQEITCVRITIGDQEFKTENFLETNWKLSTDILVGEKRVGTLEVCYLEERPQSDEGPFLNEERSLLDAIAERLGRIIERMRAEEERERLYQELEAKNKELEQIVYVTSHDLRSPLVNVQGFSKELDQSVKELSSALQRGDIPTALKEEVIPILDEDIPEALQYIHTGTSKMDSLLSCLLRLSRLGRAALTIEKLDMNTLMSDIAGTLEFQIKDKDAELVIGALPPCRGDKTQINQVFSNLLDNALKYLDSNRPGAIKITGQEEKRQSIYCIEDNGVGIAPEHQAKIFEIFQQLDPGTTTGEGLGLTIVWQILDRHNGRIWLESEPGKGSRFFVALPT